MVPSSLERTGSVALVITAVAFWLRNSSWLTLEWKIGFGISSEFVLLGMNSTRFRLGNAFQCTKRVIEFSLWLSICSRGLMLIQHSFNRPSISKPIKEVISFITPITLNLPPEIPITYHWEMK